MSSWVPYAILSALAAAATAILAKLGVAGVSSNLATAIRTAVILVFAWAIVLATGAHRSLPGLSSRTWIYLGLSGVATGISWLAYFRALQLGPATRVASIDKLSLAFTLVLAVFLLGEPFTWKIALGVALIVAGALLVVS